MENLSINDLLICGFLLLLSYVFIITFSSMYYTIYNDNTKCNNKEIALDNIDVEDVEEEEEDEDVEDEEEDLINLLHL